MPEETEINLDELLSQLYSSEAAINVASRLVERADAPKEIVDRAKDYVNKAIEDAEKEGKLVTAGHIAQISGMTERAKDFYRRQIESGEKAGRNVYIVGTIPSELSTTEKIERVYENMSDVIESRRKKSRKIAYESERAAENPLAVQFNRRDTFERMALEENEKALSFYGAAHFAKKTGMSRERVRLYETLNELLK